MATSHIVNGLHSTTADIVTLCERYLGVTPVLVEQFDRLMVRLPERVQSRIDKNSAPDFQVKRYAHMMSESAFPPPLITSDNIPVDGNTRFKAYGVRNTRYIACWVLPIAWDTADLLTKKKLLNLSLALNAMNGLPLDEVERLRYASGLIEDGASDEEIVGKTGVAMSKVTSLRDQQRASKRLHDLGIDLKVLDLPDAVLRAFGKPAAMQLGDEPYKEILKLAKDAKLNGQAISSLATSVHEASTPESRRERLERERKALEPQILALKHGQQQPMRTAVLRRALETLVAHPITSFVEGNAEKAPDYVELLVKGIEKLNELRALQLSQPAIAAQAVTATKAPKGRAAVQ